MDFLRFFCPVCEWDTITLGGWPMACPRCLRKLPPLMQQLREDINPVGKDTVVIGPDARNGGLAQAGVLEEEVDVHPPVLTPPKAGEVQPPSIGGGLMEA